LLAPKGLGEILHIFIAWFHKLF